MKFYTLKKKIHNFIGTFEEYLHFLKHRAWQPLASGPNVIKLFCHNNVAIGTTSEKS
jgi:hypothetical protein